MQTLGNAALSAIQVKANTESPIEVTLFNALMRSAKFVLCEKDAKPTGEGIFVIPQAQVGKYRADFLFKQIAYPVGRRVWPPKLKSMLCVECDGHEFHSTPEDIAYDRLRDEFFAEKGIETLRITGSEIYKNANFCIDNILHILFGCLK